MALSKIQNSGLTSEQAKSQLLKYGRNEIFQSEPIRFWGIFFEEIREPMMILLLITGILYSIFGNFGDAITIFAVITLLVISEVMTEMRAKKAIGSLQTLAALKANLLRDDQLTEVSAFDVVPEDVLILTIGTKVAADAKVIKGIDLEVDESALSGESLPVKKQEGDVLYASTLVSSGEGQAEVTLTGQATRMGQIAAEAKEIRVPRTPLQLAMKKLSNQLVYVAVFFAIGIPLLGLIRGQDWRLMITTGLALAFAVIPEELPIVITMVLGVGSYNLSKQNLLIKKMRATESLANTTVIVTDKTGTLTEGKMKIVDVYPQPQPIVLQNAALCISEYAITPLDQEILLKAQESGSIDLPEIVRVRVFGSNSQKSKAIIRNNANTLMLYKSGAPEEIFASCSTVPTGATTELEKQTQTGRRVIGVAIKELKKEDVNKEFSELENDMTFSGLISFEDSPRPEVKETIARVAAAGIRTIMVTGDHPATAASIANQVGISDMKVITGDKLDSIGDEELREVVKTTAIFARATPEHKYRIVKALEENYEIVAVTGDGINDVLALKAADIGIAMGKRGTDVAREEADAVLADDNYKTLANGVFEGRALFDNLQKGMKYYLSIKMALVLIFLVPIILNVPMPFAPIQIIVLELFMDLAASAGFVAEPKEKNIYTRKPRNPQKPIFGQREIADMVIKSIVLCTVVTGVFLVSYNQSQGTLFAQTSAFTAWIFGHVVLAYVSRSEKESIFSVGIFANKIINVWALAAIAFLFVSMYIPTINQLIKLTPLSITRVLTIGIIVTAAVLILELKKLPVFNRN